MTPYAVQRWLARQAAHAAAKLRYAAKDADVDKPPQQPRRRKPKRQPRRPGDPLYRCCWCLRWACAEPMRLCVGCEGEYRERAVGMDAAVAKEIQR